MWKLVGITMFLSRAVIANINDENAYYPTETDEQDRSSEALENPRETTFEFGTSEATRLSNEDENYQQERQPDNGSLRDYSRLKSQLKRSIVRVDLRDGRSQHREAPAPLATLLYWPDREREVIGMENHRRNPSIQERRNPSFSPWGGKRDMERYKTITKIRRPVRVPFNSWGGKRNDERIRLPLADLKRNNFPNWEGKKSPPFNSWGGKRASTKFRPDYDASVKHPYDSEDRRVSRQSEQRRKMEMDNDFGSFTWLENSGRDKRPEQFISNETEIKRGSVKFIGTGEITTSGSTLGNNFPRVPFGPWGGKKREDQRSARVSLVLRKIGRFIPWTK